MQSIIVEQCQCALEIIQCLGTSRFFTIAVIQLYSTFAMSSCKPVPPAIVVPGSENYSSQLSIN